jgi:hypothetical protein
VELLKAEAPSGRAFAALVGQYADALATAERRLAAADELVANNDRDDWLDLPNGTTMTADTLLWEMFAAQSPDIVREEESET